MGEKLFCQKCQKMMDETNFYSYKDGTKTDICKKCLTLHVDNFNPDTFLWLLEKLDVPYVEEEWNVLRDRAYARDPNKMNGTTVIGKYLSKMKLKQWKQYTWADNEKLAEERRKRKEEEEEAQKEYEQELKEQYEQGIIPEAQYKTLMSTTTQHEEELERKAAEIAQPAPAPGAYFNEADYMSEDELIDPAADLTQEDKIYLAMKWGRLYKPNEWVELEKKYNEMTNSFDIQDADTIETLKLICKTSLKMNQAIDIGDVDGFQKLSRVYDTLRKSAKFTAAQNKDDKNEIVDSVGELVIMCEKEGFIPRYALDIPQDKVDLTLKDMNNYVRKLVTQDLGFGQQIEDSIKKLQIQKEMREQDDGYDFEDDEPVGLKNEDYEDYYETIEEQKQKDKEIYNGEGDDDGSS